MPGEKKYEHQEVKTVNIKSDRIVGSLYAQIVGVIVTDIDITLEFVYVNPRPGVDDAQVVSRVTIPRQAGEVLAQNIKDIIAQHEAQKGK
jgi:hypothetical protein